MMDHAAGALPQGMSLLADMHVSLDASGYETAQVWAVIGGAILEHGVAPETPRRRQTQATPYRRSLSADEVLSIDLDHLFWKRGLSGVAYARGRGQHTKFMRLEAGQSAPTHSHSALEATLVLRGRLNDGTRSYERGQIAFGVPGDSHKPSAEGNEACICFVAQDRKPFWRLS